MSRSSIPPVADLAESTRKLRQRIKENATFERSRRYGHLFDAPAPETNRPKLAPGELAPTFRAMREDRAPTEERRRAGDNLLRVGEELKARARLSSFDASDVDAYVECVAIYVEATSAASPRRKSEALERLDEAIESLERTQARSKR